MLELCNGRLNKRDSIRQRSVFLLISQSSTKAMDAVRHLKIAKGSSTAMVAFRIIGIPKGILF